MHSESQEEKEEGGGQTESRWGTTSLIQSLKTRLHFQRKTHMYYCIMHIKKGWFLGCSCCRLNCNSIGVLKSNYVLIKELCVLFVLGFWFYISPDEGGCTLMISIWYRILIQFFRIVFILRISVLIIKVHLKKKAITMISDLHFPSPLRTCTSPNKSFTFTFLSWLIVSYISSSASSIGLAMSMLVSQ